MCACKICLKDDKGLFEDHMPDNPSRQSASNYSSHLYNSNLPEANIRKYVGTHTLSIGATNAMMPSLVAPQNTHQSLTAITQQKLLHLIVQDNT